MDRTAEEKLARKPVRVTLGGQTFEVPPLVIAKANRWRERAAQTTQALISALGAADPAEVLRRAWVDLPPQLVELVAMYMELAGAPVSREWIEQNATVEELVYAYAQLEATVLPFELLQKAQARARQESS